jgi:hypothetical protein
VLGVKSRWLASVLICLVAIVGCAKQKKEPQLDLTPVSGTVTLDGKPLADADVSFAFQDPPPTGYYGSAGRTDAEGKYTLMTGEKKGAVPGSFKVAVSRIETPAGVALKPEEGMDLEQLKAAGQAKQTVPDKYNDPMTTMLSTTVEKGKADGYNFDLKSG